MKFSVFLILFILSGYQLSWSLSVKTLADEKGMLKVRVDSIAIKIDSSRGIYKIECDGCQASPLEGGPDRPYLFLNVISTTQEPIVLVNVTRSSRKTLAGGILPVPDYIPGGQPVYNRSPSLYEAAKKMTVEAGELQYFRGLPVRKIMVPLALWDESDKILTVFEEIQITVRFSRVFSSPSKLELPAVAGKIIMNPLGGRYNINPIQKQPLLKKSVSSAPDLNGIIIKISVGDKNIATLDEDGVYDLSFGTLRSFLSESGSGLSIDGYSTDHMRMFTGAQEVLGDSVDSFLTQSNLKEIPIQVIDENKNNTFDKNDVIRFYGHGTSYWRDMPENDNEAVHPVRRSFIVNPYSFYHYYFLEFSEKSARGRRMDTLSLFSGTAPPPHKTSWYYLRAEEDNMSGECIYGGDIDKQTGKNWHWHLGGDDICKQKIIRKNLSASQIALPGGGLPGYVPGDPLYAGFNLNSVLPAGNYFTLFFDTDTAEYVPEINEMSSSYYKYSGNISSLNFSFSNVEWRASSSGFAFNGYSVIYKKEHKYRGGLMRIFPVSFDRLESYELGNAENLWGLKLVNGIAEGIIPLRKGNSFSDSALRNDNTSYVFYSGSDVKMITTNQLSITAQNRSEGLIRDLRTGDGKKPEYIIIAPDMFLKQALELERYRSSEGMFRTNVVRVEDIYRDFSSGRLSPPAIRNFIRWVYHDWGRSVKPDSNLKYVLLFGDGNFDYRNLMAGSGVRNFIPPFENGRFCTDDFYAYLDHNDIANSSANPDIAIGRIPVSSEAEAAGFVEKVKEYENPQKSGAWRNNIVLTADDDFQVRTGGRNLDGIPHVGSSERVAQKINEQESGKIITKIYLHTYEMNYANSKPEAAQDLLNQINLGALMINYFGHGDYNVWADEGLLVLDKALPKINNEGRNPLITSFSCTVGRFDQVDKVGLSEALVRRPKHGAIATISASRESYAGSNETLAKAFYENILKRDLAGRPATIGEALLHAKLTTNSGGSMLRNNEKYNLFGEPVTYIRKPELRVELNEFPDTISALDCGKISGRILNGSGSGYVNVKVYGSSRIRTVPARIPTAQDLDFVENGNVLFSSTAPYAGGKFSLDYFFRNRLPFGDSAAIIKIFAWDENRKLEGTAFKPNLPVQGEANTCNIKDDSGPRIVVSGCERSQSSMVDFPDKISIQAPYCMEIIIIDSSSGVFTSNLPDEGTTVLVKRYVNDDLKDFEGLIQPQIGEDEFLKKTFKWTLPSGTATGKYLLKIRAQDGLGNLSMRNLDINIVDKPVLSIYRVFNVPNPLKDEGTCFYFGETSEQAAGEFYEEEKVIEAQIKIYNQQGLLIKKMDRVEPRVDIIDNSSRSCKERGAWWNGRDAWGNLMANGIYFYKLTVTEGFKNRNDEPPKNASKTNSLIISR